MGEAPLPSRLDIDAGVDMVLCIALLGFGLLPWLPSMSSLDSLTALSELIDVREATRFILCSFRNSSCR